MTRLLDFEVHSPDKVILVNKPVGMTPYECVYQLKTRHPELEKVRVGYAGRLDPMASGLLVLLIGDENKRKLLYEGLIKEYEVEVLFGASSDSQDLLGFVNGVTGVASDFQIDHDFLNKYVGKHIMKYPVFSSKRVNGKPLYFYAHHGMIESIVVPSREVEIFKIDLIGSRKILRSEILGYILRTVDAVNGNFRQNEIVTKWKGELSGNGVMEFEIVKIRVRCAAGTYMRWLAEELGRRKGIPSLAYSINRTQVGDFKMS